MFCSLRYIMFIMRYAPSIKYNADEFCVSNSQQPRNSHVFFSHFRMQLKPEIRYAYARMRSLFSHDAESVIRQVYSPVESQISRKGYVT
jgi:hypothetical protein